MKIHMRDLCLRVQSYKWLSTKPLCAKSDTHICDGRNEGKYDKRNVRRKEKNGV